MTRFDTVEYWFMMIACGIIFGTMLTIDGWTTPFAALVLIASTVTAFLISWATWYSRQWHG